MIIHRIEHLEDNIDIFDDLMDKYKFVVLMVTCK